MDGGPQAGADAHKESAGGLRRALASLQENPQFRLLWISNLFFYGGAWTQTLVLAWVVWETTQSEFLLALFSAVRLLPLLLGPFGGVLSDRFHRVRLLIGACVWALVAVSTVSIMLSLGYMPYWVLLLGGLSIGLAQSPSQPARAALVFDLVGRGNLSNANALNSMAINMTQVVGPALGGAMISALGAPAALWISTMAYGVSLVAVWPLRSIPGTARTGHESAWKMLSGGIRTVLSSRLTSAVLLVTLFANIFVWPIYQGFVPVFAEDVLGLGATGLGLLLTCAGVGGLAGSLIIASLGDFRFKGALFVVGTGTWGALWAMFGLSQSVAVSFLLMIGIGLSSAAFGVLQTTLLLMTTEPGVQGRAIGVQELAIGVLPISSLIVGVVAEQIGVGMTTFVSASTLVVLMLLLAIRVPELIRYSGNEA